MSSKFARAGVAPMAKPLTSATSRTRRRRLLMMRFLPVLVLLILEIARDVRDTELPFQAGQLVDVDRADDVYDGELLWFCRDDQKACDGIAAGIDVDIDVFLGAAGDLHDLLPRWPELG